MARPLLPSGAPPLALRTVPVQWTAMGWGAAALVVGLLLPWTREERAVWAYAADATGAALLRTTPGVGLALLAAALAVLVGVAPLPPVRRGQWLWPLGLAGAVTILVTALVLGRPVGLGAILLFLAHLTLAGTGLALSGALRTDPFTAAAVLWAAVFVLLFILLPLAEVLAAAVVVSGRFTLDAVRETIRSPAFFLLDRPATPLDEGRAVLAVGAGGAAVGAAWSLLARHPLRAVVVRTLAAGLGAGGLAALVLGFGAVRNSVLLALAVGGLSTGVGFLFALLGERSRLPTRRLLGPLSILPIITPPFVLGLAMIFMFGRRGFITHQLLGQSTTLFFGPLGVGAAQVLAFTPIAYLVLVGVVRALDVAMEEAAETLGASRWQVLRTVIWPLARPGLANAFLLVAIESLADFGNPFVVGGGAPFLATQVFDAISGRFNPHEAAVYGVTLLGMTLTVFLVQRLWLGRRGYVTVTGRPGAGLARPLPRWLDLGGTALFLGWVALTVLLYGSVFVGAVTRLWGFDDTVTLAHLQGLTPQGWAVLWNSVRLSALAAVPSTLLGFLIAYLVTRVAFPGRSALEFSAMLSFAVPGTVMGIGYILAFNQGVLLLTGTEVILVLAFVFRNMPVGIRAGVAALHQLDRAIEEASTLLGAGTASTLRRIVMPLVRPALLSGLVFAFVRAVTAVSQVIFLISPQHNLATTQILSYVQYGTLGRGAALASVVIVLLAAVVLALYLVTNRLDPRLVREVGA
ncbi:MAG: iron ABC transporter permease [Armatimonadota bacterium]|nr:iron ABC transporter permease [Armatimonadota bacterium]MDR7448477.1 iron ABC transporter permease [Armatimonadota bacterium]MDR7459369.1 iron ABC transporter permease [Armatimonadota bacterium]MDR7479438.1 iron ABC transporter permease [Armatimonadota bacterium]MDR7487480.1 iron ABC transporter permease [Armatimonadota bacterium]